MDYAQQQRDPSKHLIGIGFVVLVHVLVIWALLSGLGNAVIQIVKKPLTATIIEEVKLLRMPLTTIASSSLGSSEFADFASASALWSVPDSSLGSSASAANAAP